VGQDRGRLPGGHANTVRLGEPEFAADFECQRTGVGSPAVRRLHIG